MNLMSNIGAECNIIDFESDTSIIVWNWRVNWWNSDWRFAG